MFLRHYRAMTRKEIIHISRNPGTLILILFMPTLLLLLLAYAMTADIRHVPVAVFNQDGGQISQNFVTQLFAGDDLQLTAWISDDDQIESLFLQNKIKAVIILAPDFREKLISAEGLPV